MNEAEIFAESNLHDMRQRLTDPKCGYVLIRKFLDTDAVISYRDECSRFLANGPRLFTRINSPRFYDYVHPRSHDEVQRTFRIYQYFHNNRSQRTDRMLDKTISLRNKIEEPWLSDASYTQAQSKLQNYVIVTRYLPGTGMLPKHQDYQDELNYPLLQFLILLSEPGEDYAGGEFTLYTRRGQNIRIQQDLNMRLGDALIFDKSLYHQVDVTEDAAGSSIGRWSVLIGARARFDPAWRALVKRVLFNPTIFRWLRPFIRLREWFSRKS